MSMIKSNYQIESSDMHPISNLLMEATAANGPMKTPYQHHVHNAPLVGSLTPILVATNIPGVNNLQNVNPNAISNG